MGAFCGLGLVCTVEYPFAALVKGKVSLHCQPPLPKPFPFDSQLESRAEDESAHTRFGFIPAGRDIFYRHFPLHKLRFAYVWRQNLLNLAMRSLTNEVH